MRLACWLRRRAETVFLFNFAPHNEGGTSAEVRDREDALAPAAARRDACATRSNLPPATAASRIAAMLDIRLIREKPDFVRERLATRGGGDEDKIDNVLRVDAIRRKSETALQQLNADRKRLSKEIGGRKYRDEPTAELEQHVREIGEKTVVLNANLATAEFVQNDLLLQIANLPHESVPIGKDAAAKRVVRTWGEK